MRKQLLIGWISAVLVWLGATAAFAQSAYFQAVTNLNPIVYLPMQETALPPTADVETNYGSLGRLADAIYSGHNMAKGAGGATADGDTAANDSDGWGGFCAVPTTDPRTGLTNATAFTVECWVNPAETGRNFEGIISKSGGNSGGFHNSNNQGGFCLSENYLAYLDNANLIGFDFHVFNGVGHGGAEVVVPLNVQAGTWYHLVGVFDGTNCWLYVDGTNMTAAGFGYQIPMTGSYFPDTWSQLQIGSSRNLNGNNYHGEIDEVAIYTNVLSPARIQAHFNAAASASPYSSTIQADQPYMYWRMNSQSYIAPDPTTTYPVATNYGVLSNSFGALYGTASQPGVSGPQFSGMLDPNNGNNSYGVAINGIGGNNGATANVPVGYDFAGNAQLAADAAPIILTNSDVSVDPNAALLNPTNHTPLSFTLWFKANPHDWARFQTMVGHSDQGWRMSMNNAGGIQWNPGPGGEAGTPYIYDDGNWHQFVGTYDGTNVLTYVDGVLVQTASTASVNAGSHLFPIIGSDPFYLDSGNAYAAGNGGTGNTSYRNRAFSGRLAHFAFFTNVLSTAQVQSLYTAANPNQPPYILGQPVTGRVNPNPTFIFFGVVAGGSAPLSYHWYYNSSSNYVGATQLADDGIKYTNTTTGNMTISNLVAADSGYYFAVVSNNFGAVTSRLASLTINYTPVITAQTPASDFSLYVGQTFALSVSTATATNFPLSYNWFTNGVQDPTATTATYNLGPVTLGNNGETFQCVVTNDAPGTASSAMVTLTVNALPAALTGNPFSSNTLALAPTAYWPMHESGETPVAACVETNYGSLGQVANGFYDNWRNALNGSVGNLIGGSGLTNDLYVLHGFQSAIAGDSNPSVQFSAGNRSYVVVPRVSSGPTTLKPPFTLEAWVKPNNNRGFGIIVGQDSGALNRNSSRGGFDWLYSGSANTFSITVYNGTNGNSTEPKTSANYPPGVWYHVVTTFDGTNVQYYINGVADAMQNTAATINPNSWDPITIACGRGLNGNLFQGAIDEVAIYTNLLPVSEIQKHYNDGTNSAFAGYKADVLADSPILYYRMDSPTYNLPPISTWPVLTNYGSLGLNGVYTPGSVPGGGAGPSEDGQTISGLPANNSLQGNGCSIFADAGSHPLYNPSGATPFSVAAWVKGNPADISRGWQTMVGKGDSSWRLNIDSGGIPSGGSGNANFNAGPGGGADIGNGTAPLLINDGAWHYVVGTFDGTNSFIYVDNILSAKTANTTARNLTPQSTEVFLGAYPNNTVYANQSLSLANETVRVLAGSMCEAAFWNGTALTPAQIGTLYNSVQVGAVIDGQPVSASVNQNSAFTNTVVASGTGPLFYQWYQNGTPRSGQTNASLVLSSVAISDASPNWYVVVTNNYGSVTSVVWSLTVNSVPSITQDLTVTNLTLYAGGHATFTIAASGAVPLHYQWYSNNVAIAGASNPTYVLANAQPPLSTNNYYCTVTNSAGTVTSLTATVAVVPVPSAIPYSQVVLSNNPFGFWALSEAEVGGGDNGVIANDYWGGNNGIYTNVTLAQPGFNPTIDPSSTSAEFGLNSLANGDVFNIPTNVDFSSPTNGEFSIETWVKGNFAQTTDAGIVSKGYGGGGEQFDLDTGSHVADNGTTDHDFRFFVRDASGAVHGINSTVNPADNQWHHVVGVCDESNSLVTLYVDSELVGSNSIPAGSGILASTRSMLIGARPSSSTSSNDFQFVGWIQDVAVYNYPLTQQQIQSHFNAGDIPASIVVSPTNTTTGEFGTAAFYTTVIGTPPITYKWFKNGGLITGQTNATLVLTNVQASDNGSTYMLEVNNAFNTAPVDSTSATLTVISGLPQISADVPPTVFIQGGGSGSISVTAFGTMPLTYQWQASDTNGLTWTNVVDGGRITGSTSNVLAIANAKNTDGGDYQVIITNSFGAVTSSIARLVVGSLPLGFNGTGLGWSAQQSGTFSVGAFANNVLTLTDNGGSEARAAFFNYPQYIGAFKAFFTYQAGGNKAADGIAFVLQNDSRGPAALGGGGGSLGVSGITPSWELELNLYAGNNDGIGCGIFTNGANGINTLGLNVGVGSGDPIDFTLNYAQGKLAFTMVDELDSTLSFSTNITVDLKGAVGGKDTAYVGFTGATGGATATQTVTNFTFVSIPTQAIGVVTNTATITWPGAISGYALQETFNLKTNSTWVNVTNPDNVVNGSHQVVVPLVNSNSFFRLTLQP